MQASSAALGANPPRKSISLWAWVLVPICCAAITRVGLVFVADEYSSVAMVLPPQLISAPARVPVFTGDTFGERLADQMSSRFQTDMALTVLRSATILDGVLLRSVSAQTSATSVQISSAQRDELAGATRLSTTREGVVIIAVLDKDRDRAARLANGYIEALDQYVVEFTSNAAKRRAVLLDQQLLAARAALMLAESAFADSQSQTGIFKSDGSVSSQMNNLADLRQRLAVRESQLSAMSVYATPDNPGYARVLAEVEGLRRQLVAITGATPAKSNRADGVGERDLVFQRAKRDARRLEEVVESLNKQLAQAQFDQLGPASGLQVIERARVPDRAEGPRRTFITLSAGLFALLCMVAIQLAMRAGVLAKIRLRSDVLQPGEGGRDTSTQPRQFDHETAVK